MELLEHLWTEVIQHSEPTSHNLVELVYDDTIKAGDTHRIWSCSTDETLRSIVSAINSKLNDPETREYGLVSLSRFVHQIDPRRLVAIQEGITSALYLSIKSLHLNISHTFLARILPHCRLVPELNQVVTSTIVPKLLSFFCDVSRVVSPSPHELNLVKVCLQRYHGPCGNQKLNLEKTLVSLVEDSKEIELVGQVLPLVSAAGGGGTQGLKHSDDWKEMTLKILATIDDCILSLYGDACPMLHGERSFASDCPKLALSDCMEKDVFQRISLLKNRLINLAKLLVHYLTDTFPGVKPVPMKAVLNIIRKMIILDPLSILKSNATPPKEYVYLSIVIPHVRGAAYSILKSLMSCVGTNILTESSDFEEMTLQELKWMAERPEAFVDLKCGVYESILLYLEISRGEVVNPKTVVTWTQQLITDIQIKRKSVELNQTSNRTKNHSKKKVFKASGKMEFLSSVLGSTDTQSILQSNPTITTLALKILNNLIPSLDVPMHKVVSVGIGQTATEVVESEGFPSPYDDTECRKSLFDTIFILLQSPIPNSPISLSFFANLLRKGEFDNLCSTECHRMRTSLERTLHPLCPTLSFHTILPPSTEIQEAMDEEPETEEIQKMDSFCQTEESTNTNGLQPDELSTSFNIKQLDLESSVRLAVESTMKKILKQRNTSLSFQELFLDGESDSEDNEFSSAVCSPRDLRTSQKTDSSFLKNQNLSDSGIPKRKLQTSKAEYTPTVNGNSTSSKRCKRSSPLAENGELNFESMLQDFVDVEPRI